VTPSAQRSSVWLLLAVLLTGGAPGGASIGFADLPRLIAAHPLHGVLAAYDREIAALRSTRTVAGLDDPARRARSGAALLRNRSGAARLRAQAIAARDTRPDWLQENATLSTIVASRGASERAASQYSDELNREVAASLLAFERATAQRTGRALRARREQLREKELMLAYDLARRDAPKRLLLRLKLSELHLNAATRTALESQLAGLNERERDALAVARRRDAAVLGSYRRQLQDEGAGANARMASQLRAKGAANDAIRLHAFQAESNAAAALPDVPSQLALFRSSYRSAADAQAIAEGFGAAGVDLSRRFGELSDVDDGSRAATAAQIQRLTVDRAKLYRSIVAQIERIADRLARTRHLTKVLVGNSRPKGSIDLTDVIQAAFTPRNIFGAGP
jgi:hypothetical protein